MRARRPATPIMTPTPSRVLVIGSGGAGKTTLVTAIADRLGRPVMHLDQEFWRPGWEPTDIPALANASHRARRRRPVGPGRQLRRQPRPTAASHRADRVLGPAPAGDHPPGAAPMGPLAWPHPPRQAPRLPRASHRRLPGLVVVLSSRGHAPFTHRAGGHRSRRANRAAPGRSVGGETAAVVWDGLARWVAHVLTPWYRPTRAQLPDCWPVHPRAVAELSWLYQSYRDAVDPEAKTHLAADWHTRWLPAVLPEPAPQDAGKRSRRTTRPGALRALRRAVVAAAGAVAADPQGTARGCRRGSCVGQDPGCTRPQVRDVGALLAGHQPQARRGRRVGHHQLGAHRKPR